MTHSHTCVLLGVPQVKGALTRAPDTPAEVPIVTGFLARGMQTGAITTLGRGGSDLSATVLGAAMELSEVQVRGCQARGVVRRGDGKHVATERAPRCSGFATEDERFREHEAVVFVAESAIAGHLVLLCGWAAVPCAAGCCCGWHAQLPVDSHCGAQVVLVAHKSMRVCFTSKPCPS